MAGDMTTFKGKPFDRAALESLMKVCTMNCVGGQQSH